ESPFAPPVFMSVEQFVQDLLPQKGHAHFIRIREAEGKPHIHLVLLLDDAAGLAARIAAGFLHMEKRLSEFADIRHNFDLFLSLGFLSFRGSAPSPAHRDFSSGSGPAERSAR